MLVDFDTEITDALGRVQYEPELKPNGRPMTEIIDGVEAVKISPITMRMICVTALTRAWPDEKLSETVAFDRFMLAVKISPGGRVDLTLAERGAIQTATDNWRSQSPVFMARARLLLDTNSAE
ncbi:hypothetical protein ASF22_02700 [Methylobacterium sp. Leaf87]|uniref:hypothetical protein n=1 Tax=Methylobacterium sp. Leaf87 TaxID=1736243 RepID=UPI0007009473|nr:hypothetical protein [Methylobacterium sp. Leaf87]KQO69536.1 hypothetical protein ASF22_02700 [Methylobacterium sp. Leaf87]